MESEEPKLPKLYPKKENSSKNGKRKSIYTQLDSLNYFNSHYGTSICLDEEEIDLTSIPKGPGYYLAKDLSRLKFEKCTKLLLSIPLVQLKELMPRMPNLRYLGLIGCNFGRFFLKYHFFKNLEELDLTGNDFSKAESIKPAKNLTNLKILHLSGNPICYNEDEKTLLQDHLKGIKIIY